MGKNLSVSEKAESVKPMGLHMLIKVPQVTIFFWIIKIMGAAIGESVKDFLHNNLGLAYTTIIMSILLMITLNFQFRVKKYVQSLFWLVMIFISAVGTLLSDDLTVYLDVPRVIKMMIFLVLLTTTILVWYLRERTLSNYSIYSSKREAYYWLAILLTFAFGAAAGDWIFEQLSLNDFSSALMFAAVLGIVALAYKDYKLNGVLAFWLACVLTCPFGVSLVNFLSHTRHSGGLGLGITDTRLIFLITLVMLVLYLTKTRKDEYLLQS